MAVPAESAQDGAPTGTGEAAEARVSLQDMPREILWIILGKLPSNAATANALCGVCKGWRDAILSEDSYLNGLAFKLNPNQPFRGLGAVRGAVAHRRTWASKRRDEARDVIRASMDAQNARFDAERASVSEDATLLETVSREMRFRGRGVPPHMSARALPEAPRVPVLLERACEIAKNVSALECLGLLRDHQGDHARAHKAWKKAAVLGSAVGQFKLGEIFYRGLGNHGVDGEEALFWLQKATKAREAGAASLPSESLGVAAGIMGFLHLDGEGCQACNTTAVKWFKVAADAGNKEASTTLGWMYNTGQY
jgi:TPR repeat protein